MFACAWDSQKMTIQAQPWLPTDTYSRKLEEAANLSNTGTAETKGMTAH